jgi:spore germination protein GerM
MPRTRTERNLSLGWLIAIGLALFATGGAAAWFTVSQLRPSVTPSQTTSPSGAIEPNPVESPVTSAPEQPAAEPSPSAPETERRSIYWLKVTDTGAQLVPREVTIQKSTSSTKELETLLQTLLAGSSDPNNTSTIPPGTKLLSLQQDKQGIQVNLSREFTSEGGASALIGRLAQVLYTATSIDSSAPVWIQIDGQPLTLLGEGEGIEVAQPMTRQFFQENYQLAGN